jgi:hypothetical protein
MPESRDPARSAAAQIGSRDIEGGLTSDLEAVRAVVGACRGDQHHAVMLPGPERDQDTSGRAKDVLGDVRREEEPDHLGAIGDGGDAVKRRRPSGVKGCHEGHPSGTAQAGRSAGRSRSPRPKRRSFVPSNGRG